MDSTDRANLQGLSPSLVARRVSARDVPGCDQPGRCQPGMYPGVVQWPYSGDTVALQWVTVALQWENSQMGKKQPLQWEKQSKWVKTAVTVGNTAKTVESRHPDPYHGVPPWSAPSPPHPLPRLPPPHPPPPCTPPVTPATPLLHLPHMLYVRNREIDALGVL